MLVCAQHGLGVGVVRDESVPGAHQLRAQLGVVVELPVEHDAGARPRRAHRLLAALDVDDGEAPHADGELLADLRAPRVRPAVLDRGQHRLEQLRFAAGEAGYAAHGASVTC